MEHDHRMNIGDRRWTIGRRAEDKAAQVRRRNLRLKNNVCYVALGWCFGCLTMLGIAGFLGIIH